MNGLVFNADAILGGINNDRYLLKYIDNLIYLHTMDPVSQMYDEDLTYDTKHNKIIIGYYQYGDNVGSHLYVLNAETFSIESIYDYSFYPIQAIDYDVNDNVIRVFTSNSSNYCYEVDADNLNNYQQVINIGSGHTFLHDPVTNHYLSFYYTSQHFYEIDIYESDKSSLILSTSIEVAKGDRSVVQGVCAYNNKLYTTSYANILEINPIDSTVNKIGCSGGMELEGLCFIEETLHLCGHPPLGEVNITNIYKYDPKSTSSTKNKLPQGTSRYTPNTNLNYLLLDGSYNVETTEENAGTYNYPYLTTKGTLIVKSFQSDNIGFENRYVDQFYVPENQAIGVYKRQYVRVVGGESYWSNWKQISPTVKHFTGTTDSSFGFLDLGITGANGAHPYAAEIMVLGVQLNGVNYSYSISMTQQACRIQVLSTDRDTGTLKIALNLPIDGFVSYIIYRQLQL